MYSVSDLLEMTEKGINLLPLSSPPSLLYDPICYSMANGGKRVRPLMMLLSSNMFSNDIEEFLPVAIGIEMFHGFTLLHDDIMDNSPTRRGMDSVHKRWGSNVAILSGDAMMIYAYKLILSVNSEKIIEVMRVFNKLSLELCEGQQYDMDFESKEIVSMDEYINMINLKTSVLIAGATKIGAILGGASNEDSQRMYDFGLNIGTSFQLKDDILDIYGDPKTFGKPIGGDIIEGKKSYIFLLCYQKANSEDRELLLSTLASCSINSSDKISIIREVYDKYSIREFAEKEVENYFHKAMFSINDLSISDSKKQNIIDYAKSLLQRVK